MTQPGHSDNVDGLLIASLNLNSQFPCPPPQGNQIADWVKHKTAQNPGASDYSSGQKHFRGVSTEDLETRSCTFKASNILFTGILTDILSTHRQFHRGVRL